MEGGKKGEDLGKSRELRLEQEREEKEGPESLLQKEVGFHLFGELVPG